MPAHAAAIPAPAILPSDTPPVCNDKSAGIIYIDQATGALRYISPAGNDSQIAAG